jgi:tellurite resistance protein TerA
MAIDYRKSSGPVEDASTATAPVSLTKERPSVPLTKQTGRLHINLSWQAAAPPGQGGLLKRLAPPRGIDLDLGCLYELTDGSKGVVQALGNSFGSLERPPYVWLNGDDRSGGGGEDLFVNLEHAAAIRRVLVFACIYDGAPSFEAAKGVVALTPAAGPPIQVRLDETSGSSRMCAIAMLEGAPGGLSVRCEVRYVQGGQDVLDKEYGWGMTWSRGRK